MIVTPKAKLYHCTAQAFALPTYVDHSHRVITTPAQNIPMLKWPDGRWCLPANVYMVDLYHRGLSRRNRGGTLLTYAAHISHLIRYCYDNQIDVSDLTDNQFALFVKALQGERRIKSLQARARDANSVIAIGRTCLDFLACVGRLHHEEDFVSPSGRIRAEQKLFSRVRIGRWNARKSVVRVYWHHRAFPTPDSKRKRLPISTAAVAKLRESVLPLGGSLYLRKRRYVMLTLLEVTGGRRSEVAALTVESVWQAARMEYPMLKLLTVKRAGGRDAHRLVPIARHDLVILIEFIEKNRRRVVRTTCGLDADDGVVLVSETTGHGLSDNTITQEIHKLRRHSGIEEQACPHMFRHRFITKLFVALIEQHHLENQDEIRRALLDAETMKQKIQQWTGHKDLRSLDTYINLAFEETANFKKIFNLVSAQRVVGSFATRLEEFQQELLNGASPTLMVEHLVKVVAALREDLEYLKEEPACSNPSS